MSHLAWYADRVKGKARLSAAALGVLAIACCGCSSPPHPPSFDPMQPDSNNLMAVLGPLTGTGSRTLTVTASRSMSLTIACIGTGELKVYGLLTGAMLCHGASLSRGAFAGYYWAHMRVRAGEDIKLRVAAAPKTIWDIRVEGLARHLSLSG